MTLIKHALDVTPPVSHVLVQLSITAHPASKKTPTNQQTWLSVICVSMHIPMALTRHRVVCPVIPLVSVAEDH